MISVLLSRLCILVFGTLYPAYASYKTVKTKNVRHYVKWMMYWIVFALYTAFELFADIFIAFWFPFYYELKILFVIWLVCPATRGSTYIFINVINPQLGKHEEVLDSYIASLWNQGYNILKKMWYESHAFIGRFIVDLLRKGHFNALSLFTPATIHDDAVDSSFIKQPSARNTDNYNGDTFGNDDNFETLMPESSYPRQKEESETESEYEDSSKKHKKLVSKKTKAAVTRRKKT